MLEDLRYEMYKAIEIHGKDSEQALIASQRLDIAIVNCMKSMQVKKNESN